MQQVERKVAQHRDQRAAQQQVIKAFDFFLSQDVFYFAPTESRVAPQGTGRYPARYRSLLIPRAYRIARRVRAAARPAARNVAASHPAIPPAPPRPAGSPARHQSPALPCSSPATFPNRSAPNRTSLPRRRGMSSICRRSRNESDRRARRWARWCECCGRG